ncbi:MAG: hypothetical protein LAP38_03250 [Acidobacteriia bacterium]|nr:hypothetical protein [Terriglobia bacterium]
MTKPLTADPPPELIEEALMQCVEGALEQFSCDLSIARRIWRNHRALVEAPEYPEPYRSFENMANGELPDDTATDEKDGLPIEKLREKLLPEALKMARLVWRCRKSPETAQTWDTVAEAMDAEFLKGLGITPDAS